MAVIYFDRNTTSENKLQVAIKYTLDLAVCNVGGGGGGGANCLYFFSRGACMFLKLI